MALNADGDVWHRTSGVSDTFIVAHTHTSTTLGRGIWFAKGRFILALNSGELGELLSDGTFVVFDTVGAYEVVSVAAAGPAIISAVTDGTVRSYVPEQSNQADADSVNLVIRGRTEMPKGEVPTVLGAVGSVVTILTVTDDTKAGGRTARFYRAEALSAQYDYVVGGLQMQREWFRTGEAFHDLTANMAATRDSILFAITESDGHTYVWRFDLVTFGLSRHSETFGGVGHALTIFDGKAAIVRSDVGEEHLYVVSDSYHHNGYVISPNLTFGLNTDIAWIASVIEGFDVEAADGYVELWRTTNPEAILDPDHISWVKITRLSHHTQSGAELPLLGVSSRTLALQIKFFSRNGVSSPNVTRVAIRGIPQHRDWIVNIPVNVSDYIEVPFRRPLHSPGIGDKIQAELMSLVGKHMELVVSNPSMYFNGVIDAIEEPVEYISPRGSASRYMMVQFRGSREAVTAFSISDGGIGMGLIGMSLIGVGMPILTTPNQSDPNVFIEPHGREIP